MPTRCAACPSSLLYFGPLRNSCLNISCAATHCRSAICAPSGPAVCAHHAWVAARVVLHCALLPILLQVGTAPLGSKTKCCAPTVRCGMHKFGQRDNVQPQMERCYNAHQSPNITRYIAVVSTLNNINERGPHLPPLMYKRM